VKHEEIGGECSSMDRNNAYKVLARKPGIKGHVEEFRIKVKVTLQQATKAQIGVRNVIHFFRNRT
jgi:hypothetical protein